MATTINCNPVLFNGQYLFKAGQVIQESGRFPLSIQANPSASPRTIIIFADGLFQLHLDGYNESNFDQASTGSGTIAGQKFEYMVHATFVGTIGTEQLYNVRLTVYAV